MASRPKRLKFHRSGKSGTVETLPPGVWDCSVCTYRNVNEAFKCAMCDVRKGTSTRKPRLSSTVVEQQQTVRNIVQAQQAAALAQAKSRAGRTSKSASESSSQLDPPTPDSMDTFPMSPSTSSKASTPTPTPSSTPGLQPSSSQINQSPNNSLILSCSPPRVKPRPRRSLLKRIDRNSARTLTVTVNSVTVVITDYKLIQNTPDNNTTVNASDAGDVDSKTVKIA